MPARLVKKITIKEIIGIPKDEDTKVYMTKLSSESPEIAAIVGDVTGFGGKMTQYGESFFLTGSFMAQNRMTGEVIKSGKMYLPKDVTETIIASVKNREHATDATSLHLTIKVVPDLSQGFTYICEPVKTIESVSREAEMEGQLLALGAPKPLKSLAHKKTA
jgi:hypothetical protein